MIKSGKTKLSTALALCLAITGCSTTPTQPEQPESAEPVATPPATVKVEEPETNRPFPPDTLYSLLVAEFAGQRNRFDISLAHYLAQTRLTRDPQVASRAARIASYLKAPEALEAAQLWLDIDPESRDARNLVANQLARRGQLREAMSHLEILYREGAAVNFHAVASLARQASASERQQLIERFDQLLQESPDNSQLLFSKALLLQQLQQREAALNVVQTLLKQDPNHLQGRLLQVKLLEMSDQMDAAIEHMAELVEQHPDNPRFRLQYARLLANVDLNAAHQQFVILADQDPSDLQLQLSLALVEIELKQLDKADQRLQALVQEPSIATTAYYHLGQLTEQRNQPEIAIQHYLKVTGGNEYYAASAHYTQLMIRLQQWPQAHQELEQRRQQQPDDAIQLYLIESEELAKEQMLEQSYQLLSEALLQHGGNTRLLYARSMVSEQMDDLAQTEADLRQILLLEPNSPDALNALGYTLADRTTRYEEAYELISQALALRPNDPAILDSMGWVEYRLGNYQSALTRLRQALKAYPDHEVAAHLGEVLWTLQEYDQAQQIWRQGLELNPDSKIIQRVMERLLNP